VQEFRSSADQGLQNIVQVQMPAQFVIRPIERFELLALLFDLRGSRIEICFHMLQT
jgi:hypothetical protein